ncbi:MAG TPA: alpha-amylase/4-alpha-glucanotransferase domain-containing protein [Candidatus Binatia bacterium]|nr:alpha-amylase/4-alpha-glucanotransferase domain-containing protein [Candidatus Binatia bacterium]
MAGRISLALVIHNHQPVGNFGWVVADVFEQAYRPFVDALDRHPGVRCALHYSGPLLDWLRTERPEFLDRLRALVERGQVEILGGGWAEPILVALPSVDRVGQLRRLADELEAWLGRRPTGAWLAERVWEPDLPVALVDAGYAWTVLDDYHFRAAAVPEDALWGPYTTDDQGRRLTVFASDQGLRYRIPFKPVEDVIDYLRAQATPAGDRLATMGDDGEKFGAWPTTYAHCWGRGAWIERFFEALEANADWLRTTTPSAWFDEHAPVGRAAIPTASYAEMGEWALPPDEARAYAAAVARLAAEERPERRWLRGTSWRNFLVKYREANDLHKQMLRVSAKVNALPEGPTREAARRHLYRGQSNDAYWHGLFGGLYLTHLRLAVFGHLIAAEDLADRALGEVARVELGDIDLDGRDEVLVAGPGQVVVVDPAEGGGIGAWDVRAARVALAAVLRRRPEAYHARLLEADRSGGAGSGAGGDDEPAEVASIHELAEAKEPDLAEHLVYDDHELRSGLARLVDPAATAAGWRTGRPIDASGTDEGAAASVRDGAYEVVSASPDSVVLRRSVPGAETHPTRGPATRAGSLTVEKTIRLGGGRLDPTLELEVVWTNGAGRPCAARPGLEWSFMLLGGGGNPAAFWEIDGERSPHDARREARAVVHLRSGNTHLGLTIETEIDPPAEVWIAPIETVSHSESGLERTYQGSQLLCLWPAGLEPGETRRATIRHRLRAERDLAAAEGLDRVGS